MLGLDDDEYTAGIERPFDGIGDLGRHPLLHL
jgi:hypothetical protein